MAHRVDSSIKHDMLLPSDANCTGRDLGQEEIRLLTEVIKSGTLWSVRGKMVKRFEKEFADKYGINFCIAVSSGTAALHTAIAAINPDPGSEIITSPVTDMGAIAPILYQNAIPVFADVDPISLNISADTIEPRISKNTKAIIVTHLFGNPCDMDPILKLAQRHNFPVIEDCCQAYLAEYKGRLVGTLGDISCFSMQQGKHMTTGEGGMLITNDENYAKRIKLFVNKAWGYGESDPDHYFLALNYRMTELQGAVAIAQLAKLEKAVKRRQETAKLLTDMLSNIDGLVIPPVTEGATHAFWRYSVSIDKDVFNYDVTKFTDRLKAKGIHCLARYIQKPAFMCQALRKKQTYGNSQCPFSCPLGRGSEIAEYNCKDYPGAIDGLSRIIVFPWNKFYTKEHISYIAQSIKEVLGNPA